MQKKKTKTQSQKFLITSCNLITSSELHNNNNNNNNNNEETTFNKMYMFVKL